MAPSFFYGDPEKVARSNMFVSEPCTRMIRS